MVQRLGLLVIAALFIGLAAGFARSVPIFEASDEAEHFVYVHHILERGALPVIQSREQMANQDDPILRWSNQSHHPPLYYLAASALVFWTERDDVADYLVPNELIFLRDVTANNANKWLHRYDEPRSDTHVALFILRAANALLGLGTLLLVYLSTRELHESRWFALLTTAFVASIPTFVVVHSSVSNDPLLIFLYSAGLLWLLRRWNRGTLRLRDHVLMGLILGGLGLTKLTGLSLGGLLVLVLLLGVWRKKWRWRGALRSLAIMLGMTALLAGWWYVRNAQLYGDLLALEATQSIWGRETPFTLSVLADELLRIWKSFWMMVGYLHAPVFAPDAFYGYTSLLALLGTAGLAGHVIRSRERRGLILLLLATCAVVLAMLLYGTRSVDISYGRLLLPAIAAFAPLVMLGLVALLSVLPRFILSIRRGKPASPQQRGDERLRPSPRGEHSGGITALLIALLLLPLLLFTALAPNAVVRPAYPRLEAVDAVPEDALPVGWSAEGLTMLAVDVHQEQVSDGDTLRLDLYVRGNHALNPALLVTAVDSRHVERLGHIEVYPGMAATNLLSEDTLYRVPLRVPLALPNDDYQPRMVSLLLEWVDVETNESIVFDSGEALLEIWETTLTDPRYAVPTLAHSSPAQFGDVIRLHSYEIAHEGGTTTLSFVWEPLRVIEEEWVLTLQAFDEQGALVAQEDGQPYWYPTTGWVPGLRFLDGRTMALPPDAVEIRVGWYRQEGETFLRLPVSGGASVDSLLVLEE